MVDVFTFIWLVRVREKRNVMQWTAKHSSQLRYRYPHRLRNTMPTNPSYVASYAGHDLPDGLTYHGALDPRGLDTDRHGASSHHVSRSV
jgi:hypothetical protein